MIIADPLQPQSANIVAGIVNNVADEVKVWGEISHGVHTVLSESGVLEGAPPDVVRAAEAQTTGVIMTQLNEMRQNPGIVVKSEDLTGDETLDFLEMFFAAMMPGFAVMFAFFLVPTVITGSFFQKKEDGSFRRLLAAPIHRGAIIAGKMVAYMLVAGMQVFVLFTVGNILGMSLGDSLAGLVLITVSLGLAVTALGMLVAALARSRNQADSIGNLLGFALEGYFRLLAEGGGVGDILPQVGILAGISVLFYLVAMWRFKFE
ncbi:MAG: ABC transporter permease [Anaerolineae bacterium]